MKEIDIQPDNYSVPKTNYPETPADKPYLPGFEPRLPAKRKSKRIPNFSNEPRRQMGTPKQRDNSGQRQIPEDQR